MLRAWILETSARKKNKKGKIRDSCEGRRSRFFDLMSLVMLIELICLPFTLEINNLSIEWFLQQ